MKGESQQQKNVIKKKSKKWKILESCGLGSFMRSKWELKWRQKHSEGQVWLLEVKVAVRIDGEEEDIKEGEWDKTMKKVKCALFFFFF